MTIPGKPAPEAEAPPVAELHLGGSRAAELEARMSEEGGEAETRKELVIGPGTSQLAIRPRPGAEPWARKERVEWESGRSPSPDLRAHTLLRRRNGRWRLCRVRREMPRSIILIILAAGVVASLPPPAPRSRVVLPQWKSVVGVPSASSCLSRDS